MSRSYRHTPIVKDNTHKGKKPAKRIANKIVRARLKDIDYTIADGTSFKKEYCSYNIADCVRRWTREEAIKHYNNPNDVGAGWVHKIWPTLEEYLNFWEHCMKRK